MAYDKYQAERIRQILEAKKVSFIEKNMMGGWCVMVDDKMLCGLLQDKETHDALLMARVGEDAHEFALKKMGAQQMTFTGRPMKGYVFVRGEGMDRQDDLENWIHACLSFNPMAIASKKKTKKKSR